MRFRRERARPAAQAELSIETAPAIPRRRFLGGKRDGPGDGPSGASRLVTPRRLRVAIAGVLAALVGANLALDGTLRPASPWGLGYGIAASVALVVAMALGLRRRSMRVSTRLGLGSARTWLVVHVWIGTLFGVLVLMHAGFRWPIGVVTTVAFVLSLWTVLSGAVGLVLQRWIPRALSRGVESEVLYDRIPELRARIDARAEIVASGCSEPVQELYRTDLAPRLRRLEPHPGYFLDIAGGIRSRLGPLRYLRRFVSDAERAQLDELEALYRTKLELDAHATLQPVLRLWLYAHVPPAVLLLALVVVHVASVVYY